MIDLLYVSYNRLEFTKQSFAALAANTDWALVDRLYVKDDGSTDGTFEWLVGAIKDAADEHGIRSYVINGERIGGPVAAMNWYLDHEGGADIFGKVDNDMVVCPGWLGEMLEQTALHPTVDIIGMEPFLGDPSMPDTVHRDIEPCEHIGGKGLLRRRAFNGRRPQPGGLNGYFGFTEFQTSNPEIVKAWIKPDLPVFGLDQVRPEDGPWRALAEEYAERGWQRLWPVYGGDDHYAWWTPALNPQPRCKCGKELDASGEHAGGYGAFCG